MKTSSKAFLGLGIFVVIVAAALFLLLSGLDRIVAAAIEKYGSEATGTKVGRITSYNVCYTKLLRKP